MLRSYKSTDIKGEQGFQQIEDKEFIGPEIIFKIRKWTDIHHRKILTRNEIFFASPLSFPDPHDCKLKIHFGTMDSSNSSQKLIRNMMLRYPQYSSEYILDQLHRFLQDKQPYSDNGLVNNLYSKHMNEYFKRFGVFSATINFENPKIWERYGGMEYGFCIGIMPDALDPIIDAASLVKYYQQLPMLPEPDDENKLLVMNLQVFSKEEKWMEEKEYRLAKRWNSAVKNSMRKQKIKPEAIKQVILAPHINPKALDEIKSVLAARNCPVKLYESILITDKIIRGKELSF